MNATRKRLTGLAKVLLCGACLLQTQCSLDPDLLLRAGISAGSDMAIFLLENLARGI